MALTDSQVVSSLPRDNSSFKTYLPSLIAAARNSVQRGVLTVKLNHLNRGASWHSGSNFLPQLDLELDQPDLASLNLSREVSLALSGYDRLVAAPITSMLHRRVVADLYQVPQFVSFSRLGGDAGHICFKVVARAPTCNQLANAHP